MKKYIDYLNQNLLGQEGIVVVSKEGRPRYVGLFLGAILNPDGEVQLRFSRKDVVLIFSDQRLKDLFRPARIHITHRNGAFIRGFEGTDFWIGSMCATRISWKLGAPRGR